MDIEFAYEISIEMSPETQKVVFRRCTPTTGSSVQILTNLHQTSILVKN